MKRRNCLWSIIRGKRNS